MKLLKCGYQVSPYIIFKYTNNLTWNVSLNQYLSFKGCLLRKRLHRQRDLSYNMLLRLVNKETRRTSCNGLQNYHIWWKPPCKKYCHFRFLFLKTLSETPQFWITGGKSKRTSAANSVSAKAKRVILLSGTPALSRPEELFSQLQLLERKPFTG
jgi:hypothetical protein